MSDSLEPRNLTAGYGKIPVIVDVTVTVEPREIVAVFGANGAGKTTLLRALMGAIKVTSGSIYWAGADITKKPAWWRARNGLAHIPEGRQLFGAMTVAENLEVAGQVTNDPESAMERVFSLFPRLRERRRQRADTLSGGEQQMVSIGRAFMLEPRCVLVDELSAGLAPKIAHELLVALDSARDSGMGVLIVEQSPHLVADLVDRVYLLQQGKVVAAGTYEQLGGSDALTEVYLGGRHPPREVAVDETDNT